MAPEPDAVKRTRTSRSVVTPIHMKFEVSPVPHLDPAPKASAPGTSNATPAGTTPPAGTRAVPVEDLRQLLPYGHDHSPLNGTTVPDFVPEFVSRGLPSP